MPKRSYVARCCRCKKIYRTTTKHKKWGRCPVCDARVEKDAAGYNWVTRGQRVKADVRGGYG